MQSTEGCWMAVHPYSKYEKAEMLIFFVVVVFLSVVTVSIFFTSLYIDFTQNIKQCEY